MVSLITIIVTVSILMVSCAEMFVSTNYALIIDAGSTGSRSFIFKISEQFDEEESLNTRNIDVIQGLKLEPGLSSFFDSPSAAVAHILPAIRDAANSIPISFHKSTQVYIKGTAGMRLLSQESQNALWDQMVAGLSASLENPFYIQRANLGTIDGHLEAYYAVLSSNFIAGSIDASLK